LFKNGANAKLWAFDDRLPPENQYLCRDKIENHEIK